MIDSPATGSWNMAMDQALLESTDLRKAITLRFYRWSEPTLSLGYFQRVDERESHLASRDCSLVRRSSGGGAIMHDHELTYSICVPESNRWSKTSDRLYDLVHHQIIEMLAELGIQAKSVADSQPASNQNQSFLCFERRTPGDVLVAESKIGGSAQRRLRNALLQHGSLLLRKSGYAPELPGLAELTGKSLAYEDLCHRLAERLGTELKTELKQQLPTKSELESAKRIQEQRFLAATWNRKR